MVKNKFIQKPGKLIKDKRGSLQNIITGSFASCMEIFSKKGTIRSNHYHKKDSHYIYIVKGEILWAYKKIHKDSKLILKKLKKEVFFSHLLCKSILHILLKIVIYWHLVREQEKKIL